MFLLSSGKRTPEKKSHSPLNLLFLCINFTSLFVTRNLYQFHIHVRLHFKTPVEIHACDSITTWTEQQYSQTLSGRFFAFTIFICSWASSCSGHSTPTHLVATHENHSSNRPAPIKDTFLASQGCSLTRASSRIKYMSPI